ncbi:MAG TPA: glycosyltransferase family 39 protein [Blastocatellia bacterium]|nr:glycosyltransferase family 39 protein [Blastocatellia bacterium]
MTERSLSKFSIGMAPIAHSLVFVLPAVGLVTALSYAHFDVKQMGDDNKGSILLVDRMFDVALALALIGVVFCIGRKFVRLISLAYESAAEEISFSVMFGVGIVGLIILALGLAGLLAPVPVTLSIGLLMILSGQEVPRIFQLLKEGVTAATSTKLRFILTILFGVLVLVFAIRAITPPHTPDEAIYHLSVTKRFVDQGRILPVEDNWAGNMPFLVQMLYAICLMAGADIAAKVLSFCLALVCSLSLYGFSRRFLTRRVGVLSMFSFFAAGMVVEVAVTSRIDVSLAGMLFLAIYSMMVYLESGRRQWLYASAVLSGFGLGIKYSAAIVICFLGIMFLVESLVRRRDDGITAIKRGMLYTAIVAAVAAPWFIKNFIWFRNPVYPFITGEAADIRPGQLRYFGPDDQAKLDAHFERARTEMPDVAADRERQMADAASKQLDRHPLRFWEYFIRPDAYNMAEEGHYPNYLFVLAPLMVFVRKNRWLTWLGVFSVFYFIAAVNVSWVARMLLPIYPALTLISAYTLTELAAVISRNRQRQPYRSIALVVPVLAVAIVLGFTVLFSTLESIRTNDLGFIKGDLTRTEYMKQFYYYPPSYYINNSTPENSRVMMIGAQTCYDLKRDYIADTNWDSTEWRRLLVRNGTIEQLNQELRRRGVTHVWVAYGLFTFVAEMGRKNYPNVSGLAVKDGPDYKAQLMNWSTLDLYSKKFLQPVYNDNFGNIVYRIK